MQLSETSTRRFRIVNVTLPKAAEHEQEIVPVLLDDQSGLPLRLAMRWVMRSRRSAVGEKPLTDDLLEQLIEYLREEKGGSRGIRALSTTGQLISNIERFLRWLAKPLDRGGATFVSREELVLYHEQLAHTFSDLRAFRSRGQRKPPLTPEQDMALMNLIGPTKRANGQHETPLRFQDANPWKNLTRLRNWIGYQLSHEFGVTSF